MIGLDLDNTIACYDGAIARLAAERLSLPADVAKTKIAVRDHLRKTGREDEWTEFQGYIYGPGMDAAMPFPGAIGAITDFIAAGHDVAIISHRTRHPYRGPKFDLHEAARAWIAKHLIGADGSPLLAGRVSLFDHRSAKISHIHEVGCHYFVDDLIEVLIDAAFPNKTGRIWFSPDQGTVPDGIIRAESWADVRRLCL